MARYIYDEVKNELEKDGIRAEPCRIAMCMARIAHEKYGVSVPGFIPEDKMDEFHDLVLDAVMDSYVKDFKAYLFFAKPLYEKMKNHVW
jgi:hypothetical protein